MPPQRVASIGALAVSCSKYSLLWRSKRSESQGLALFILDILGQMKKLPATCLDGRYRVKFDLQGSS
jgi:hypothetical protein